MKKILCIALLILLGVGGYIAWNNAASRSKNRDTASVVVPKDAVIISMRQDEYVPSEITIKKGQTIVFKNESNEWRWPASNLHPTHDIYPEFDPKEPVGTGKSWAFRFDKSGSWSMHDHLAPYITGTITVSP